MNSRDRAREEVSKIFTGYVKIGDVDEYIVYEIKGITRKSARLRLKKIVKNLSNGDDGISFTIKHIFDPEDIASEVFRRQNKIVEERTTVV